MEQLRVAIAESNGYTGRQLLRLVESDKHLLLVGQAHSEDEVLEILRTQKPDMILNDSILGKVPDFRRQYRLWDRMSQMMLRDQPIYMGETDTETRVTKMIQKVGIPAHVKGYQYVRDAIVMVVEDPDLMVSVTKVLYPEVARKNYTTPERVERAMRHAIEIGWERGKTEILEEFFGYTIHNNRGKPTNSEFVAMLADKIRLGYDPEDL